MIKSEMCSSLSQGLYQHGTTQHAGERRISTIPVFKLSKIVHVLFLDHMGTVISSTE